MASPPNPPKLTLYANYVKTDNTPGQISAAPVLYNQLQQKDDKDEVKLAPPYPQTNRNLHAKKAKPKFHIKPPTTWTTNGASASGADTVAPANNAPKTFDDWAMESTDTSAYRDQVEYRKQKAKMEKKAKKNQVTDDQDIDWTAGYNVAQPTPYQIYRESDDYHDFKRAFKVHVRRCGDHDDPEGLEEEETDTVARNPMFAPPPEQASTAVKRKSPIDETMVDATSGEEAYARRLRLTSGTSVDIVQSIDQQPSAALDSMEELETFREEWKEEDIKRKLSNDETTADAPIDQEVPAAEDIKPQLSNEEATIDALTSEDSHAGRARLTSETGSNAVQSIESPPSNLYSATITGNPVMYAVSPAAIENDKTTEQGVERRETVNTQTQRNKAIKMMAKYGWTKGKGLGANEDGILDPIRLRTEKPKKNAPVTGHSMPGGTGRIVGGTKAKGADAELYKFGNPSKIVVALGLLDGVDLEAEMQRDDGGIRQRMGDVFSKEFGNVERLFIHESTAKDQVPVFIKFTDELSAVRAVNMFDRDFRFEGKTVIANFFDEEKFEDAVYE